MKRRKIEFKFRRKRDGYLVEAPPMAGTLGFVRRRAGSDYWGYISIPLDENRERYGYPTRYEAARAMLDDFEGLEVSK